MPIFESEEPITDKNFADQQQQLNAKMHRRLAQMMVDFISPGSDPAVPEPSTTGHYGNPLDSFDGGDSWEPGVEDAILPPPSLRETLKSMKTRGRVKLRGFRTKVCNRLSRMPFYESIKSAIRRRP